MRKNKFIRRKQEATKNTILLLILILGLGYALIQSNLTIAGTAGLNNPTWDIHWENVQVQDGSVTGTNVVTAPTIDTPKTTVTYSIILSKPGDYYEFTVDAVNAGTIDGMIESITSKLNGTTITTLPAYLEYEITYADYVPLEVNQLLAANTTETYRIQVKYKEDINLNQIPASNQTLSLQFTVKYKQAENSVPVRTYLYRSNTNDVFIGDSVSALGTYYTTYQAVVSNTGRNSFIRHVISNNQVVQNDVGFVYNNNVYYLNGGRATFNSSTFTYNPDSPYYETNLVTLISVFGSDHCSEQIFDEGYICTAGGYTAKAGPSGYVEVSTNSGYCFVDGGGTSDCGN